MSQGMKTLTIIIALALACNSAEGKDLKYRHPTNEVKQSYIVHYNNKGEPLSVAGFDDFVRVLNGQQAIPEPKASSFIEVPEFPPSQATPTTVSGLMTTTEPTTSHQPRPLATGTSRTQGSIDIATASPEPKYVSMGSSESPLKLPHEMSGTSPMAEASVSTDKPTLTLALGHDAAGTLVFPGGPSFSEVSNLVTPGEFSPSKTTVSGLGFSQEKGSTSQVISLQPGVQTVLNYALPTAQVTNLHRQTSYGHPLPLIFQKSYAPSSQPGIFNFASYPNQNIANDGNAPLQIVRQSESLIDIGQGLGQGYRLAPQELPLNLGGWGGVDYSRQRSIRLAKPVFNMGNFGHTRSSALSKIGFGPGSW